MVNGIMANPIFNMFGSSQFGNMAGMIQQFEQFKRQFQGDPKMQVQQMLNSGKVTQDQYNKAVQIANAMQQMMNMK